MLSKNKLTLLCLLSLLLFSKFKIYSQTQKGMLMYQIENKQFKKTSFDKNGKTINYQYIKVGKIIQDKGVFSLEIKVKSFNENGTLKKEEISKYSCKTKKGNIFMGVFPFINKPSKKFNIDVLSGNTLYPPNLTKLKFLSDYRLRINYKTGLLGISAKINMSYINRRVKKINKSTFVITGEIEMNIFVAGVNVSNVKYKSDEKLETSKGIIYQKFIEDTGAYFTIQLLNK